MPPKQNQQQMDQFLAAAPDFMNTMAGSMAALTAATNQLNQDMAANAAQVNANLAHIDTDSLTQSVQRLGMPAARPYNSRQPHKWATDLMNEMQRWSQPHADSLTTDPVTNAATVPPTLAWANDDNRSAMKWATDAASWSKTRHIDVHAVPRV